MTARQPFSQSSTSILPASRSLWRIMPQPFDLVSTLLYIGVLVPYLFDVKQEPGYTAFEEGWRIGLMSLIIAALLLIDRGEYRYYAGATPRRAAITLISLRVLLIEVASVLDQFRYTPFLYLVVLFLSCLYLGDLVGYVLLILSWIIYFVKHFYYHWAWLSDKTELHYLVLFIVGCTFAMTMGRVVAREKASRARSDALLRALEQSHQQLQAYAHQVEELTTTRERNRLAREIHDSLGHYLTVIIVQLEKALLFRDKKPQEADQAVSDAKRLAGEALQDVRYSVGTLRSTQALQAFVPAISELVEHVHGEHCRVEVQIEGSEIGFSQQGIQALYRVVQEGLTNVQKHAKADHVWLTVHFERQEATLTLCDNGMGFDREKKQRGYGLRGLSERLELVGGTLKIESVPGEGSTLSVTVPKTSHLPINNQRTEGA